MQSFPMPEIEHAFFRKTVIDQFLKDVREDEFEGKARPFEGFTFKITYEEGNLSFLCVKKPLWATCGWIHKRIHDLVDEAFKELIGFARARYLRRILEEREAFDPKRQAGPERGR